MLLVAGTAIVSGTLILLGWFTLPVRVAMLAILAMLAWRSFKLQASSFKCSIERIRVCSLQLIACSSAALAATLLLWNSGTTDPIRSPWSVVPVPFFFLYALIGVFSIRYSVFSISIALALASLVAILVYPLGFGFDHFIHAAAERIIATTDALSPPPFFYSGHYGLTVLLADLLPGVNVDLADRLLTPLLVIIFLVPLAYRTLRSVLPDHAARLGLSSLLIVPFLPLAVSTPQATANVFALATIFLVLRSRPLAAALTALAALLSQPMTGIITIAVVAMASPWRWLTKKTRSCFFGQVLPPALALTVAAAGAMSIPLAFAIAGRIVPGLDLHVAFNPLPAFQRLVIALWEALTITTADFATADALAVAHVLLPFVWVMLATIGVRTLWRGNRDSVLTIAIALVIALAAAAAVAATVTVPTQLGEEQSQFPLRLVQLATLLATPLAAIGLGTLLDRVWGRRPQIAAAIAVGAVATFTLLLAYPRDDAQARSGLWSVSADDIAAVHAIAEDAGNTPYVVLANQMLGAAAIREFGFKPAHVVCVDPNRQSSICNRKSEILSFPLPAGGPIARKYWEFVSQEVHTCSPPSPLGGDGGLGGERWCINRAPIDAAVDLVGAQRAYVVLHDYWRNAERLATATAAIADAEVDQFSHLRVFRLTRRP